MQAQITIRHRITPYHLGCHFAFLICEDAHARVDVVVTSFVFWELLQATPPNAPPARAQH